MGTHRLRQRLQSTVLEASTQAGKAYNAIFGAILLSVLPCCWNPTLANSALRQTNVPWIDLVQNVCGGVCGGFRPSSGLGGEASPLPVQLHRAD